uniref:Uncharacterized protein n=1 Tax=Oryza barthii TaxID=65489 RepID=A0A0D3G5E4_9ORYZ
MGGTLLHLQMVPHNVKLNGFSSHLQQVNKPTIPLGAGAGAALVSAFATMLPSLRWKRFAVVAALCILAD